uniref:Uncharacterized protein n=1 Tax=Ditylenchus dipsaci TaxID=166011 RepID=A0A915DKS9_9BILA
MIPLYPPQHGPPAFGRPKWRSLVHLITPSHSRRASFDLGEDSEGRQRRPSAPAVLHDLRRILPGYVHRRYHSSSALLQTTAEEEEELAAESAAVVENQKDPLNNTTTLSEQQHHRAAPATTEFTAGGGARFKCKRIKAAREADPKPEEQQGSESTDRTPHSLFKSKAKENNRGFWQAYRKVSSVSLAAPATTATTPLVVVQHTVVSSSQSRGEKNTVLAAFSTCSSYVRLGGNENRPASTLSTTSISQQQQPSEQTNNHPAYRKEGIQNPKTVFQQHRGFFSKLLEEHKHKLGNTNPRKVSSTTEVYSQLETVDQSSDIGQPLPQQEDFAESTHIPLQEQTTYLSNPSLNTAPESPTTKSPQASGELSNSSPLYFPLEQVPLVEKTTLSPLPSPQSIDCLEEKVNQEEVFQKASTSANDDSSASNCGCGRFLLTDQPKAAANSSSRRGSSSVKVVSTRTKVKSRRRGVVVEEPNDSLYIRRHTIPDMTVAAYGMVICGTDEQHRYRGRIEKVKFGVPISEAFSHDIPATLLVLLLKVNKEGPLKRIYGEPRESGTTASVIKKFLAKLPGGYLV